MRLALLLLALASPAAAQDWWGFQTPSGNIHCAGSSAPGSAFVDCEIVERDRAEPLLPRPADCPLEWGDRFTLAEGGPGALGCHGDTVRDPAWPVLPYGQEARFGPIACAVSEQGLECRNAEGGGFFLSRARQALF